MTRFASIADFVRPVSIFPAVMPEAAAEGGRAAKQAHQAAEEPRPPRRGGRVARRFGRGATRRASTMSRSWSSPAITASPRKASRPIRPRSRRRWWRTSPPAAPPSISSRSVAGAELRVVALDLDHPTADFTVEPAMDEAEFLEAVSSGYDALSPEADLVVLGRDGHRQHDVGVSDRGGFVRRRRRALRRSRHRRRRAASSASARRSIARSPGTARSSTIPCASPPRSADASLPRSSAPRSPRGIGAFRSLLDGFVCTAAVAPLGQAPRRCARPCACRASCRRSRATVCCLRSWPSPAARSRHAARRRLGRRGRRARAPRRARLPHRHGDFRRGASVGEGRLGLGDGVEEGAGDVPAPSARRAELPPCAVGKLEPKARRCPRAIKAA